MRNEVVETLELRGMKFGNQNKHTRQNLVFFISRGFMILKKKLIIGVLVKLFHDFNFQRFAIEIPVVHAGLLNINKLTLTDSI